MNDESGADDAISVRFWGVRGSVPACGPQYDAFGGHTPCVEIRCGGALVCVDAGTGIVPFGMSLLPDPPATIDILLSHLHLDHVGGLPFFKPAHLADRTVRLHCGNLGGSTAEDALCRLFSPPLFPIQLDQLPARFEHRGFAAGDEVRLSNGLAVSTHPLNHPGGSTGYRFAHAGRSVCYISDIEHGMPWPPPDLVRFIDGADLVIFDGMFSEAEYLRCRGWGHSTWEKGVSLCEEAGVARLAIFHLHPGHDDAYLAAVETELKARMPGGFLAREGTRHGFPPL